MEIRIKEKRVQLFFNKEKYLDTDTTYSKPRNVMGIEASFVGAVEIDYVHISDKEGTPELAEDF
jgi:hypothetical protein